MFDGNQFTEVAKQVTKSGPPKLGCQCAKGTLSGEYPRENVLDCSDPFGSFSHPDALDFVPSPLR
jgi:hypothetical protein